MKHLPYSHAPTKKDKERQYTRFLDIFKRLKINIPFDEALEQIPTCEKFMKDILTKKRDTRMDKPFIWMQNAVPSFREHFREKKKILEELRYLSLLET